MYGIKRACFRSTMHNRMKPGSDRKGTERREGGRTEREVNEETDRNRNLVFSL